MNDQLALMQELCNDINSLRREILTFSDNGIKFSLHSLPEFSEYYLVYTLNALHVYKKLLVRPKAYHCATKLEVEAG